MLKDFDMLEYQFNDEIKILPISDVHLGHPSFMEKEFKETIKYIQEHDNVYTILGGDICDNAVICGTKSIGVLENNLSPMQQVEKAVELLTPIKDKILGCVLGNHSYRSMQVTGINPVAMICSELGISNVYRENLAIIKIKIGKREDKNRATYTILLHHGTGSENSAVKRDKEFINSFEGADIIVTGHVHNGKCSQHVKKIIDPHNNNVFDKTVTTIICNSYLGDASYALRSMLIGSPHSIISFDLIKSRKKRVVVHID